MTERKSSNEQPSGIWQSIWAELMKLFNEQMILRNYAGAWETMKLLKVQIPPECETDTKEIYDKTLAIMKKTVNSYSFVASAKAKERQIQTEAPDALLRLMGETRNSLYNRGWISKDFSASPISSRKPHISSG